MGDRSFDRRPAWQLGAGPGEGRRARRQVLASGARAAIETGAAACHFRGRVCAEADGNRTRRRHDVPSIGFEDRGGHQAPGRLRGRRYPRPGGSRRPGIGARRAGATGGASGRGASSDRMSGPDAVRLTQYARGGGCACKIPPGELEETVARLMHDGPGTDLMVGVEHGDDGAVVRVSPALAVVVTAGFFAPVVDDAYTFGRIAAANALSGIYAMGGEPLVAVNLLGWRRDKLPAGLAAEVLRGGLDVGRAAHCHVAGGHSIDDPEPKYGMAVTGTADPAALLRIDAGRPGLPVSLTEPIGTGVLNAWHKATGQVSAAAVEVMTTLNAGETCIGCSRTPTRGRWSRTTCCCSRTRRRRAGCWWPGSCLERR